MDWKAKAAAEKILGKEGNVPDLPAPIDKAKEAFDKAYEAFEQAKDELEAKLLEMENANSAAKNAIKQFRAKIEKEDFDLDEKNKDQAKKIQQARKILLADLDEHLGASSRNEKTLDELDKHLIQMGKYKPA